jgi:hypothetical protein
MLKSILTLGAAVLALSVPTAYAQNDVPGEGRAAPSKSANAQEKQDAKMKRKSTGKDLAAKDEGRLDDKPQSAGTKTKVSAEDKALAKAKRKSAGAAAAKSGSAGGEAKQ